MLTKCNRMGFKTLKKKIRGTFNYRKRAASDTDVCLSVTSRVTLQLMIYAGKEVTRRRQGLPI